MAARLSLLSGVVYFTYDPCARLPGKILQNAIEGPLQRTACLAFLKMVAEVAIPIAYENVESCRRMIDLACEREYVVREVPLVAWATPPPEAVLGLFTCAAASFSENRTRWYAAVLVRPVADLPVGALLDWVSLDGFLLTFGLGEFNLAVVDVRALDMRALA